MLRHTGTHTRIYVLADKHWPIHWHCCYYSYFRFANLCLLQLHTALCGFSIQFAAQ